MHPESSKYVLRIIKEYKPTVLKSFNRTVAKAISAEMFCRQLSIEMPGVRACNFVSNSLVQIKDTPASGARIRIICAGVCFNQREREQSSKTITRSSSEEYSTSFIFRSSRFYKGLRAGSIYVGFEVSGIVESLGVDTLNCGLRIGQRVIIYPYEGAASGYAELLVVPEVKYVIPIPSNLSFSVAAMLPTTGLLAMNAVALAKILITESLKSKNVYKVLIVGSGALALWAARIAEYKFALHNSPGSVDITVAFIKDEGIDMSTQLKNTSIVEWNESLHEPQLIERTKNACGGLVDIVIDFGSTSRSLLRSMHCVAKGGHILITQEASEILLPTFSILLKEYEQRIVIISQGLLEQLHDLVNLVACGTIAPPPYTDYPFDQASEVVPQLCHANIGGRAILRFDPIE